MRRPQLAASFIGRTCLAGFVWRVEQTDEDPCIWNSGDDADHFRINLCIPQVLPQPVLKLVRDSMVVHEKG
jgi:hypothetical protein